MKKIIILIILTICYLILNTYAYAASPSPTASTEEQINELKDRIASRVAQLNLVEKRGIIGVATDVTGAQITLTDIKGDTRFIDVDELTKFDGESDNGSFGISDIKKGSALGVLGLYNKQSRRILSRTVEELVIPKMLNGNIATIDSDNFILNVATDSPRGEAGKKEQLQIEFETTTRSFSYNRTNQQLIKSGFSKIKIGESIFVVGFADETVKNKINAERIIILPDIIKGPSVELSPSIVPSTGSGKILTPIVK